MFKKEAGRGNDALPVGTAVVPASFGAESRTMLALTVLMECGEVTNLSVGFADSFSWQGEPLADRYKSQGAVQNGQRPVFLLYWEVVSAGADLSFFFFTARTIRVPTARRAKAPPPARSAGLGRRSNSTAQKTRLSSVKSKTR